MEILKKVLLRPDLWALDEVGKTVMYLINGDDKALLIDTGFGLSDLKSIVRELCGEKEIMVVNSHGHVDHTTSSARTRMATIASSTPRKLPSALTTPYCQTIASTTLLPRTRV